MATEWEAFADEEAARLRAEIDPDRHAEPPDTEPVKLMCSFCGHWEVGQRTKDEIAEWLRVHRAAAIAPHDGGRDRASTCPHPCGTARPDPADTDEQR